MHQKWTIHQLFEGVSEAILVICWSKKHGLTWPNGMCFDGMMIGIQSSSPKFVIVVSLVHRIFPPACNGYIWRVETMCLIRGGLRLECDFAGIKVKSSQIVGSSECVLLRINK